MKRRFIHPVAFYVWASAHLKFQCPREDWWDGSLIEIDGKKYCNISELLWWRGEPDFEILACGHELPVRTHGPRKEKGFRLRRRCPICILEAGSVPA